MPSAAPALRFRRSLRCALGAAGVTGLLLAGCSFSEGPDWPPLTPEKADGEATPANGQTKPAASAKWQSLAKLAGGEPAAAAPGGGALLVGLVRPLVVIRFADPPVDYEETLYQVIRTALERRPQTALDLVAVAPGLSAEDQAAVSDSAQAVARSLSEMGFPAERLSISATSRPGVVGSEVHLYVR